MDQSGIVYDPAFDGIGLGQSQPGQQGEMKAQTPNLFAPGNAPFMPMANANGT